MALRENQVYQIGLIISVMLMVVLAVLAFWGISSSNQAEAKAQDLQEKLRQEENVRRSAEAAVDAMKIMIGSGQSENLDPILAQIADKGIADKIAEVRTLYNNDLRLFASTTEDAANRSWRSLVADLLTKVTQTNELLQIAQDNVKQANSERDTEVKKSNDRATSLQNEVNTISKKLASVETQLEAARDEFTSKLAMAEKSHSEGVKNYSDEISNLKTLRDSLATEVENTQRLLASKVVQLRQYERKRFMVADGRIVELSPSSGKVYINLGFADGLYRRVNFSVFGRGIELEAGLEKATLEVTNILGAHQAEARIVSMNDRDPILPNDQIVTATWDPGYEVPVAISGRIDLDNDGESDLARLKGFIAKNHGILASVMDEEGNIEGKIDLNTRYLIVGDEPEGEKQRSAFSEMDRLAAKNGVQKIAVREFLHLNGFHPEPAIQSLASSTKTIDGFTPRRPPSASSAFDQ